MKAGALIYISDLRRILVIILAFASLGLAACGEGLDMLFEDLSDSDLNYKVATPNMSPAGGAYYSDQDVTAACATVGATIYYTTDGSDPTVSSIEYTGPISVAGDGTNMTIKAIAVAFGLLDSSIRSEAYTITYTKGSYDTSFNNGGLGADSNVHSIAIQPDGKIVIGASLLNYNGVDVPDRIIRLNTNGSYDNTFNNGETGSGGTPFSIAIQSDGKIIIGGGFTTYNGVVGVPDYIIRLNTDGSHDNTFNNGGSGAGSTVEAIAIQGDGKILIGGFFTDYNGVGTPERIIRLNIDGSYDNTFNNGGSGTDGTVYAIAIQSDGKIIIGGTFSTYNGVDVPDRIIRLNNADGSVDNTFNNGGAGLNDTVYAIAIQSDGKIIVGGGFSTYNGADVPDGIIRLNIDGSYDNTFNNSGTGAGGTVRAVAIQSDGKIISGGDFIMYNGVNVPDKIIRLNTDGTYDNTFNNSGTGADGSVRAIAIQSDEKVIIGGYFDNYNGEDVPDKIIRLN